MLPILTFAQEVKRVGDNFKIITQNKTSDNKTKFTYTDNKNITYPIYISKSGSCYIIVTSKKGNQYKKYLGKEISKEVCKELNVKYSSDK